MAYTDHFNRTGILLSSLDAVDPAPVRAVSRVVTVPKEYVPTPDDLVLSLLDESRALHSRVLPGLPSSESFVASFSYLAGTGWVLWDVYGQWYRR